MIITLSCHLNCSHVVITPKTYSKGYFNIRRWCWRCRSGRNTIYFYIYIYIIYIFEIILLLSNPPKRQNYVTNKKIMKFHHVSTILHTQYMYCI